jgi:hypothetical protein
MKKLLLLLLTLCYGTCTPAYALDLREYFPQSNTVYLKNAGGNDHARYTFTAAPSGFSGLYNTFLSLNKPGYHYVWQKEYWKNGQWCTVTNAVLFMGDDLSVTEVGDWYSATPCTPNTVYGYKTAGGVNTGLEWSPVGGLTEAPAIKEMNTWSQSAPGAVYSHKGYQAYSKTGVIEVLSEYTVPVGDHLGPWGEGNGRTYQDVVHIIMYHGTKKGNTTVPIRCPNSPISAYGAYYQSFKGYNSYGIELWLAKGIGIIQENTAFIEDATYWGFPNCIGGVFDDQYEWMTFID